MFTTDYSSETRSKIKYRIKSLGSYLRRINGKQKTNVSPIYFSKSTAPKYFCNSYLEEDLWSIFIIYTWIRSADKIKWLDEAHGNLTFSILLYQSTTKLNCQFLLYWIINLIIQRETIYSNVYYYFRIV